MSCSLRLQMPIPSDAVCLEDSISRFSVHPCPSDSSPSPPICLQASSCTPAILRAARVLSGQRVCPPPGWQAPATLTAQSQEPSTVTDMLGRAQKKVSATVQGSSEKEPRAWMSGSQRRLLEEVKLERGRLWQRREGCPQGGGTIKQRPGAGKWAGTLWGWIERDKSWTAGMREDSGGHGEQTQTLGAAPLQAK